MNGENVRKLIFTKSAEGGLYLGIYFILKYLLYMYSVPHVGLIILYGITTACVPFVVYYLVKKFRDTIFLGIEFPLRIAWLYGIMLYFFASILSMTIHLYYYVYRFPKVIPIIKDMTQEVGGKLGNNVLSNIVNQSIDIVTSMPPIQLVFNDFTNNILGGSIVALIIGLILKKK